MAEGSRPRGGSENQRRAVQLLTGAALGGHAAALLVTGFFFVTGSVTAGVSCAIACVVALAFSIGGQAIQVIVADSPPMTVLIAALASYGARVGLLGAVLIFAQGEPERFQWLDPVAVVTGTVTVVAAWLAAEIFTYSRLRIPVFDESSDKR